MYKNSLFSFLLVFLFACQNNSFSTKEDYRSWVFSESSGYQKTIKSGEVAFEFTHIPKNLTYSGSSYHDSSNTNSILVFQVRIYPTVKENLLKLNIKSDDAYKERVALLENKIENLFVAFHKEDTINPVFSHYENYRGIKNEVLVHVHFSIDELSEDFTINFRDEVFNSGTHEVSFDSDKINHPPILKNNYNE